jgi:hypothetical protein
LFDSFEASATMVAHDLRGSLRDADGHRTLSSSPPEAPQYDADIAIFAIMSVQAPVQPIASLFWSPDDVAAAVRFGGPGGFHVNAAIKVAFRTADCGIPGHVRVHTLCYPPCGDPSRLQLRAATVAHQWHVVCNLENARNPSCAVNVSLGDVNFDAMRSWNTFRKGRLLPADAAARATFDGKIMLKSLIKPSYNHAPRSESKRNSHDSLNPGTTLCASYLTKIVFWDRCRHGLRFLCVQSGL